ncbi:MAG TPA: VTT domain-containing protein [Candidatus Acidoferrales bacterium]|nr:VTT domain-containing protein [Candidatus Acidoferrales bacterium]
MAMPWRELIHQIYNVQDLIRWGGALLVCGIVFVETGLFVGFFLPGDSLLVTAGIFAAAGQISLAWLLVPVSLCAIAGDQLGYWIGRRAGTSLYHRPDSRFFKKRYLERAHSFYEAHGGKAIIIARFVPIVRTFCPPVAGAARMTYSRYLTYDIFGGAFWVCSMVLGGYTLGATVPHIDKQIHWVIAAVIFISLLPAIIQAWRIRTQERSSSSSGTPPQPR